jgi:hypothetical protein
MLARLRRRWSLSGREGSGFSLPPAELARRDSGVFEELKRLFSTTPEVGKETEANGGHRGDRTLNRTRSLFDRTRPISVQCLRLFQVDDRTRSASGHCGVRSVLQRVRSLFCHALLRLDQRVRSVMGPARPVDPSASGLRDEHVRCCFAASRYATDTSGQLDQRVRSARFRLF